MSTTRNDKPSTPPGRTAVFVCDCAGLVSEYVDTAAVEQLAGTLEGVSQVRRVHTLCSDADLGAMADALRSDGIDSLIVAGCSPRMSLKLPEARLAGAARRGGVDPWLVEVANIREQAAWIHRRQRAAATRKARDLLRMAHARLRAATPSLDPVPLERRALVVGGGPAGLAAAKCLAAAQIPVTLVEERPHVGGTLCQLPFMFQTEAWPSSCESSCVGPVQAEGALFNDRITIETECRLAAVDKRDGNFVARLEMAPRFVDADLCISCHRCTEVCPEETDNPHELGLGRRKAIAKPFARAVPDTYTIIDRACTRCGDCVPVCPTDAIDLEAKPRTETETFGAVVMATGTRLRDPGLAPDVSGGNGSARGVPASDAAPARKAPASDAAPARKAPASDAAPARKAPNVITSLQLERLMARGELARPSDGEEPEHIVFVQCAGSRAGGDSPREGVPYCSKTCCSVTAKQAKRLATTAPMTEVSVVYYRDFRTYERALEKLHQDLKSMGVEFCNGEVTAIEQDAGGTLSVQLDALGTEELEDEGATRQLECDMVVLACAAEPQLPGVLSRLGFPVDAFGFPIDNQPRLFRPTETFVDRLYAVGGASGPKTIQHSVEQGAAAAMRAVEALAGPGRQPVKYASAIDPERCSKCDVCIQVCPHGAITIEEQSAVVDPAFCQGCGLCGASCPSHAASLRNFSDASLLAEARAAFSELPEGEPRVLAMLCYWCSYGGCDLAGWHELELPECARTMRIRCSSSVNMGVIMEMFRMGVDGIVVGGCPHNSCHHMWGNWLTAKRTTLMQAMLRQMGLDERRLTFEYIGIMHDRRLKELLDRKREELLALGPNPWSTGSTVLEGADASWLEG